jgi:REP element-mobilizing transposase RayT
MEERAYTLSDEERSLVEATIRRHCEIRNWKLYAVKARTNHVHVVLTSAAYDGETVRAQLKAWCIRALKKLEVARVRFWTEGGSCRHINQEHDLEAAVEYVAEGQDRKGNAER